MKLQPSRANFPSTWTMKDTGTSARGGTQATVRRPDSRDRRIPESSLGRHSAWQRAARRSAGDLLPLCRRASNLANDVYSKNEAADLTPGEKQALKAAIESECQAREAARRER